MACTSSQYTAKGRMPGPHTFCSDFFSSGKAFFSLPSPKNSPSLVDFVDLALAK